MDCESVSLGMRVDSCLRVIRDVSELLHKEDIHPRIVEQLDKLNRLLSLIDHGAMTESDLAKIEGCTNQLMEELGVLFSYKGLGSVYPEPVH